MGDEPFEADDLSVLLAYYVEAEIPKRLGSVEVLRGEAVDPARATILEQQILDLLIEKRAFLAQTIPVKPGVELADILSDRSYLKRVVEVAVERLRGGPDSPALMITPKPLTVHHVMGVMGEGPNFGLIFGAESIYFQETVLAFQADEVSSRPRQAKKVNVLGVHVKWLKELGKASESLLVDETGLVKRVPFQEAVPLHVVQTLHLPKRGEIPLHKRISQLFESAGIEQINPYEASARADDKMKTHQLCAQYPGNKISSPASKLIPRPSTIQQALRTLRKFVEDIGGRRGSGTLGVVLQPNKGTEGYMVERFEVDPATAYEIGEHHPVAQHLFALLQEDDVLVREERGNIRFYSSETLEERRRGYRRVTLRINVAWNGSRFVAESGYVQVSKDARTFAASRGRGGMIVDIDRALASLYGTRGDAWVRIIPTVEDITRVKRSAVHAAQALNARLPQESYLKMVGIDMVLEEKDTDDGRRILPVVLEANPRPAGLARLREIQGMTKEMAKPMITTVLFEVIRMAANKKNPPS